MHRRRRQYDTVVRSTGIVRAVGGLGGFFPPLVMGIVMDPSGGYVMGFVFLVACAWMSAGQALGLREPSARSPARPTLETPTGRVVHR